jgi:hypothetical protein
MKTVKQISIRLIAIMLALGAVAAAYEGFTGAYYEHGYLWAIPIGLAVVAVVLLLWDEERYARRVEADRERQQAERNARIRDQDPFGSSSDDRTF